MIYRDQGLACPTCSDPLREFADRLVCDACGGMLIRVEDFTRSLADVGGLGVRVVADTPTRSACPRCNALLKSCRVSVGEVALDEEILHCEHHGLWFAGGMLEAVFEQLGRAAHRGAGTTRGFSRGGFSNATDSLGIRKWWDKPRPTHHTPFTSTLAGRMLACPTCRESLVLRGMLWTCDRHGAFVENAALEALASEMAQQLWELPQVSGSIGSRYCPACATALVVDELEQVRVDRCADHGVWFEPGQLEAALAHVGRATRPEGGWLRRFFG